MNDLTESDKVIIYNIIRDKYFDIVAQDVSHEIRQKYLQQWQDDLWVILEKLKQQGWNVYGEN